MPRIFFILLLRTRTIHPASLLRFTDRLKSTLYTFCVVLSSFLVERETNADFCPWIFSILYLMSDFYSWWTKARLMLLHPRDIIRAQSSTEITHQVPRLHTFSLTLWLGFFSWDISFLMHQCSSMPRQHFLSKSLQNVQFLLQNFWHTLLQKDRRWFLSSSLLRVGLWKYKIQVGLPVLSFSFCRFASITINLGPTFLSGALAANSESHLNKPSCPLIQGPFRHYVLNVLWIFINLLCVLLTMYHLYKLYKDLSR